MTEAVGIISKPYLVPWASKHGKLKAEAIARHSFTAVMGDRDREIQEWKQAVDYIPDSWFTDHKLKREDFWKDCEDIKEQARERGHTYHTLIEDCMRANFIGQPLVGIITHKDAGIIKSLAAWLKINSVIIKSFEETLINDTYGYQGTPDAIGEINGRVFIIDWKFTNGFDLSKLLQLAGYGLCLCKPNVGGVLVRFFELKASAVKDTVKKLKHTIIYNFEGSQWGIEEYRIDDLSIYYEPFLECLNLAKLQRSWKS